MEVKEEKENKKEKSTRTKKNSSESLHVELKNKLKSDSKVYYMLFCDTDMLRDSDGKRIETYEQLKKRYKVFENVSEESCKKYKLDADYQSTEKFLLGKLHHQKMVDLYNRYYDLAMDGQANALKSFDTIAKSLFAEQKTDDLREFLQKIDVSDDDEEDYTYTFEE